MYKRSRMKMITRITLESQTLLYNKISSRTESCLHPRASDSVSRYVMNGYNFFISKTKIF